MKKVGFFGGTFDPVHFGHINLALQLLELAGLDEVLFCPAARSPFKDQSPTVSAKDRMAMTQLAIQDIPVFKISALEIERPGPSYTIDTLRLLKKEDIDLYLLLSEDALESFHLWKEFEKIVKIARPLIGSRGNMRPNIAPSPVHDILEEGLITTRRFEISSTEIREKLKKGLYCGHLIPAKVLSYIKKNNLYS